MLFFPHCRRRWLVLLTGLGLMVAIALQSVPAIAQGFLNEQLSEPDEISTEQLMEQEFETYFGEDLADVTQSSVEISETLARVGAETNTTPAVLWAIPKTDHLRVVVLTPGGTPVVRRFYDVPESRLRRTVRQFQQEVSNPNRRSSMAAGHQLYQWLIEPFESRHLQPAGVDTILFCLGSGLRGIPLAALYDGDQFLVEHYSLTRIPAFNLIQTDYQPLNQRQILAMGASTFETQPPLPAVPTELQVILQTLGSDRAQETQWNGQSFLNQTFTLPELKQQVETQPFDVVHLATHAEFRPGRPDQSYIQFWDTRLQLSATDDVAWDLPPLELLVLSACRTALGDDTAELGFAGLALKSGVKSALASLWTVSDFGTLALMSEFYQHLGLTSTKAAALQTAQINMINGEIRVENDQLVLSDARVDLPSDLQNSGLDRLDLSHPFYWAGFTMISSPW